MLLIAQQLAVVKQVTGRLGITRKRIEENKTHHFLVCKSKPCLHHECFAEFCPNSSEKGMVKCRKRWQRTISYGVASA